MALASEYQFLYLIVLTCLLLQEEINLFCSAPPLLGSDGSDVAPLVQTIATVQKAIKEEEEEESEGWSSFGSSDSEAA